MKVFVPETDLPKQLDLFEDTQTTETITIDLPLEELGRLALMAHNADMKLNDYIVHAIVEHIELLEAFGSSSDNLSGAVADE